MAEKDIVPELIENINNAFRKNCIRDVEMRKLSEKAADGAATYSDAYKYAESIGTARANAFKSEVSSDVLPDGRMYYNIASRVMEDSLTTDHEMVANFAQQVQEAINKNAGISLKAQKADLDEDRIDGFVQRLSREEDYDKASWLLNEPIKTHARSVVDDTVKKNAAFQHKAGIKVQVKRDAASDCCKWCDSLVGDYTYPGVPREVFARHDNCRCSLDYNGKKLTAYQSGGVAHSFRDQGETEKIKERIELSEQITDRMGKAHTEQFKIKDENGKEKEKNIRVYQNDRYPYIYSQTNSSDSQATSYYINQQVESGKYGDISKVVIAKNNSLGNIAAYDHAKNALYISEELVNAQKFSQIVSSDAFPAKNIKDVLEHELGGHKQHWDSVNRYYQDNRDRFTNVAEAKNELESKLFRFVNQAEQQQPGFIANTVSKNASYGFYETSKIENRLNELIADANVKREELKINNSALNDLVDEVLHYDGKSK